jgi:hypothetical protein
MNSSSQSFFEAREHAEYAEHTFRLDRKGLIEIMRLYPIT